MGKMKELFLEEQQKQLENLPHMNFIIEDLKKSNKEYDSLLNGIMLNYSKILDETADYNNSDFFIDLDYILERYQKFK
jgi:hypothetical protein